MYCFCGYSYDTFCSLHKVSFELNRDNSTTGTTSARGRECETALVHLGDATTTARRATNGARAWSSARTIARGTRRLRREMQRGGETLCRIDEVDGERSLKIRASLRADPRSVATTAAEHLVEQVTEPTGTRHVTHVEAE